MENATRFDPTLAPDARGERGQVVGSYDTYADAERAVDRLADSDFPVEQVEIVGRDLRLVEQVTGRMTVARATIAGAGTGAWFGLLIGLLIGLFAASNTAWLGLIVAGLVIGAVWGAVFGFIAQWSMHGRRDFASMRGLVASRYDVTVSGDAARARELLAG
jgi:hypothetical protein